MRERISRSEGIELVKQYDGVLSYDVVEKFCSFYGIEKKEFFEIVDRFTNKAIFMSTDDGDVIRDSSGQLIKRPDYLLQ
jgi:hypothetical protein